MFNFFSNSKDGWTSLRLLKFLCRLVVHAHVVWMSMNIDSVMSRVFNRGTLSVQEGLEKNLPSVNVQLD